MIIIYIIINIIIIMLLTKAVNGLELILKHLEMSLNINPGAGLSLNSVLMLMYVRNNFTIIIFKSMRHITMIS